MGHYTTKPLLRRTEKLNIKVRFGRLDDRPVSSRDGTVSMLLTLISVDVDCRSVIAWREISCSRYVSHTVFAGSLCAYLEGGIFVAN